MPQKKYLQKIPLTHSNALTTLVENRKAFTLDNCELNIFETYEQSNYVPLLFNDLVITSMVRGKKIMHLFDKPGFDYLPGESVIVPAGVKMNIDFPEAQSANPSQCIALAIEADRINHTIQELNAIYPKADNEPWKLSFSQYHFNNDEAISQLINRIIAICTNDTSAKDVLADLAIKELLVRIMQSQQLQQKNNLNPVDNPMAYVLNYIRKHIQEKINIDSLSEKACMSRSTFYRRFKQEFGISPLEFVVIEKVARAKQLLEETSLNIATVGLEVGIDDPNYFTRIFKKTEGMTPGEYKHKKHAEA